MVSPSRGLPADMHQVAPTSNRPICNEVQEQVTSVCVTIYRFPSLDSRCIQSILGGPIPLYFPISSHSGQGGAKLRDYLCRRITLIAPAWPNMPWFWDLVAMSSQIPLSLPNLPNLLTQPFNQIPHKNLTNLNILAIKEQGFS